MSFNKGTVMRAFGIGISGVGALMSLALALASEAPARAGDAPDYFKEIVGAETATPAEVGAKDILALNATMFDLYANTAQIFKKNILAEHPVILGLFSGAGGRFILYRPGQAPLEAPSVPIVYQLLKSVGHSTMALSEVVVPYLNSPNDLTWRSALAAFRSRMQSALDGLDAAPMRDDWKPVSREILQNNIAFMDDALKANAISPDALQAFARKQGPLLKKNIAWAAQTQVEHWMGVIAGWKDMLGSNWNKTYAASNTIYVARQNNVLFSVLAQFFPPDAINDRLMLIETISFTTTPDDMLDSLTRIIADRSVGAAFFGDYHLMDYELMGGDARDAVIDEDKKRNIPVNLPPQAPFGSHQWPMLVTPGPGPKTLADLP
ncbi:MAG TPA: hypothetical protein VFE63_21495 [Roseiarcus sp.]|nr:hypothetical protein [Roseiarcus sp.]